MRKTIIVLLAAMALLLVLLLCVNKLDTHKYSGNETVNGGNSVSDDVTNMDSAVDAEQEYSVKKNNGMTIVNMGDSLFGMYDDVTSISSQLADISGAKIYNCGFGGATLSARPTLETWNPYSMCSIADAIVSGDFSEQRAHTGDSGVPGYFVERIERLASIDFSQVDIVTIAYGTNDFTQGKIPSNDDKYDVNTMCGALRYSIETIGAAYPNIRFVICTPMWRCWFENGELDYDCDTYETNGRKLANYAAALKAVANEYHLPVCDYYNEMGLNRYNWQLFYTNVDGTHPHADGRYLMAKKLADVLAAY